MTVYCYNQLGRFKNVDESAQRQLTNRKRLHRCALLPEQCWKLTINKYIIINISYKFVDLELKNMLINAEKL